MTESAEKSKNPFRRYVTEGNAMERTGVVLVVVVVLFLASLICALTVGIAAGESESVANVVAIVRDIFLILLALQAMLITLAIIVLMLQVATLINLIQNEVRPITKNLQDAAQTMKGTSEFLSEQVTTPIIESKAWAAGLRTMLRDIRGAKPTTPAEEKAASADKKSKPTGKKSKGKADEPKDTSDQKAG